MANSLSIQEYLEGSNTYLKDVFDPEFRERMQTDPGAAMSSWGMDLPPGVDVRVCVNTEDTFYVTFPPDPNAALSDESLGVVAGGKTASSAGSVGCASTIACLCGTASTGGSASSAGSVASKS